MEDHISQGSAPAETGSAAENLQVHSGLSAGGSGAFWADGDDAAFVDVPGVGRTEQSVTWPRDWHQAWHDGQGGVYVDGKLLGPMTAEERLLQSSRVSALRSDIEELRAGGIAGALPAAERQLNERKTVQRGSEYVAGEVPAALRAHLAPGVDRREVDGRFIGLLFAARRLAEESIYRGFSGRMQCEKCLVTLSPGGMLPHEKNCPVQNVLDAIAGVEGLLAVDAVGLDAAPEGMPAPANLNAAKAAEPAKPQYVRAGQVKVCRDCGVEGERGWGSATVTDPIEEMVHESLKLNQLLERPVGSRGLVLWTHDCMGVWKAAHNRILQPSSLSFYCGVCRSSVTGMDKGPGDIVHTENCWVGNTLRLARNGGHK